jgi:hypothetical protein
VLFIVGFFCFASQNYKMIKDMGSFLFYSTENQQKDEKSVKSVKKSCIFAAFFDTHCFGKYGPP